MIKRKERGGEGGEGKGTLLHMINKLLRHSFSFEPLAFEF